MPNYIDALTKVRATRVAKKDGTSGQGHHASKQASGDRESSEQLPFNEVEIIPEFQDFMLQDYYLVEDRSVNPFCDADFPADDSSILPKNMRGRKKFDYLEENLGKYKWMRPKDILRRQGIKESPKFYVEGSSRFDVRQNLLGDCWILASLAALAEHPNLMKQVMPQCEDYMKMCNDAKHSSSSVKPGCRVFDEKKYTGKFTFRFWKAEKWVKVDIDDRLPTLDGQLIFARKSSANEFWCALAEKAYAKLCGTYANLVGGHPAVAMKHLTGGMSGRYYLDTAKFDLVKTVDEAQKRKALIVFGSISGDAKFDASEEGTSISMGHAYSCTKYFRENQRNWFKLRNPWGEGEWSGVGSDDWVQEHRANRSWTGDWKDFKGAEDGEFLMALDDVHFYFRCVDICYVDCPPPFDETGDDDLGKTWFSRGIHGQWVPGRTAGGPPSQEAYSGRKSWTNPRYRVTLRNWDDGNSVHQLYVGLRQNVLKGDEKFLSTGFSVYEIISGSERTLLQTHFPDEARKIIFLRLKLKPGTYEIVPFTGEPDQAGKFSLRVVSDRRIILKGPNTYADH